MSDIQTAFETAVADAKNLDTRPDNASLLKLYGLYKQGSQGDIVDPKPGFGDMVGRAKWDAWHTLKGTPAETAMQQYIDLVEALG